MQTEQTLREHNSTCQATSRKTANRKLIIAHESGLGFGPLYGYDSNSIVMSSM